MEFLPADFPEARAEKPRSFLRTIAYVSTAVVGNIIALEIGRPEPIDIGVNVFSSVEPDADRQLFSSDTLEYLKTIAPRNFDEFSVGESMLRVPIRLKVLVAKPGSNDPKEAVKKDCCVIVFWMQNQYALCLYDEDNPANERIFLLRNIIKNGQHDEEPVSRHLGTMRRAQGDWLEGRDTSGIFSGQISREAIQEFLSDIRNNDRDVFDAPLDVFVWPFTVEKTLSMRRTEREPVEVAQQSQFSIQEQQR